VRSALRSVTAVSAPISDAPSRREGYAMQDHRAIVYVRAAGVVTTLVALVATAGATFKWT